MKRPWLAPLTPLYAAGVTLGNLRIDKGWKRTRTLAYPVISIGNLSSGGTGKTPFTIALARLLISKGFHVDVLSRGYGRQGKEPARVLAEGTATEFGDEPLLIAREAGVPVYVARQRYDAGLVAERDFIKEGGDFSPDPVPLVHLLDDGFQHRQLFRDIDIVLVNREDWNDALLPAGNLRETRQAARRAHVLAIPADDPAFEDEFKCWGWSGPVWRIHRRMDIPAVDGPVLAFCGIARPDQFFAGLEAAGVHIVVRHAFGDHHSYARADIEGMVASAREAGATALLTTEKDAIRLGSLVAAFPPALPLRTSALTIQIDDERKALDWLEQKLAITQVAQAHRDATGRRSHL
ncbi:MAG: tetraacyldisaccharide 4'-kinase [Terracidiphilus sp.]